jgi:hypothetical protein
MIKRLSVAGAIIVVLSPLFAGLTFAQVDPEKALIGKWAGQAEVLRNQERTLVIDSVKATGSGEWTGYGSTDGGNVEINIAKRDNEFHLEYVGAGGGKAPYHLKMVAENKMEGTVEAFQRGRVAPARITFEKVKVGEVK